MKALRAKGATLCHARLQNMFPGEVLLVRVAAEASEEMHCCSSNSLRAQERASTGPRMRPLPANRWQRNGFISSGGCVGEISACCNLMKSHRMDTCWSGCDCTEDQSSLSRLQADYAPSMLHGGRGELLRHRPGYCWPAALCRTDEDVCKSDRKSLKKLLLSLHLRRY